MNKKMIQLSVMIVVVMMITTGCTRSQKSGDQADENGNVNNENIDAYTENSEFAGREQMKYDDSMISLWMDEEGSYKLVSEEEPSDDYSHEYSFHIPQINADTEGAKAINAEIQQKYSCIEDAMADIKEDGNLSWENYIDYNHIEYKTFWNDKVVSIIITGNTEFEYVDVFAACYDAEKGKKLTNEEIFQRGNISEENWLKGMQKTVAYESDKECGLYSTDFFDDSGYEEMYGDGTISMYMSLLEVRALNISEHINTQVPVYLDQNGEVVGILSMEGVTGVIYDQELKPHNSYGGKNFTAAMNDCIHVKCDNGKITVIVDDCDWSRNTFLSDEFKFGVPYEVGGVLKDYVDCKFISIFDDMMSVPVFLSDDGMVSYIDLAQGIRCGYLCMTEPLIGFLDLKDLESHTDEIKNMLEKIFPKKDNYFDSYLMGVCNYEWLETTVCHKTEALGSYTSNYSMGYGVEEDNYSFSVTDSRSETGQNLYYEGTCKFMGMVPEGRIFSYEISDDESVFCGTFLLNVHGTWDEQNDYYKVWAEYTYLGGVDFFDSDGKELQFEKSMSVG